MGHKSLHLQWVCLLIFGIVAFHLIHVHHLSRSESGRTGNCTAHQCVSNVDHLLIIFTISIQLSLRSYLPNNFLDDCRMIVVFALSGATSNIYTGSRILYGLALDGQAPAIFRQVSVAGMPVLALCVAVAFTFLTYVGQHEQTQGTFHILLTPQIRASSRLIVFFLNAHILSLGWIINR
jgi:hypothetical protein